MLTLYLIHFEAKYKHAQHYLGISSNVDRRIEQLVSEGVKFEPGVHLPFHRYRGPGLG